MEGKEKIHTAIPGLFTRKEAAAYLDLSVARLKQIGTEEGELPPTKRIGGMVFYDRAALDRFVMRRELAEHQMIGDERAYTVSQAAKHLRLSRAGVHFAIQNGTLTAHRQDAGGSEGFRYLILESELERFASETGRAGVMR